LAISDRKLCIVVAGPSFRVGDKLPQIAQSIHRAIKRHEPELNTGFSVRTPRSGERAA